MVLVSRFSVLVHIFRFPGFQVQRFPGFQFQVSRFPGLRVSVQVYRFPDFQVPRFQGSPVFLHLSRFQAGWMSRKMRLVFFEQVRLKSGVFWRVLRTSPLPAFQAECSRFSHSTEERLKTKQSKNSQPGNWRTLEAGNLEI